MLRSLNVLLSAIGGGHVAMTVGLPWPTVLGGLVGMSVAILAMASMDPEIESPRAD